ncbi:UDP-glucose 4-epimerase [Octopus bimaculoides]|uniref:UDP-glucose 4-epimerase n=1 Tax=Octopus bimaculoides TaxID=37653 RepID=UPI0022E4390C|nr:UDP-glucose 4-epimerase [Octopus bimaculoides]
MSQCVLVTGGAGYIGSHTVVELLNAGYEVVVLDNLVNASLVVFNPESLLALQHKFFCVIHLAALKAVGESCELPLLYYKNNVGGALNLIEVMTEFEVFKIVVSSSATVYGVPQQLPLTESHPTGSCINPYGQTKYFIEVILTDIAKADPRWSTVILRYFNPVGAHKSGRIGENPNGIPNNLMPFIAQVAVGKQKGVKVYGNDYDTPDGTGVRDYIHIVDLASGHVSAVEKLKEDCGLKVYNLGTGCGYSVLQMIEAFKEASGKKIPYKIVERRKGDTASCYADPSLAAKELKWKAVRDLKEMCADLWLWQSKNPDGYESTEKKQ